MRLHVLHADNHVLVVQKPPCVPMVPDASGDESLLDAAREWVRREAGKPGNVFLGVVHRLDRPISGVAVLARTSKAARRLGEAFRERRVEKLYWGIAEARPRGAAESRGEPRSLEVWLRKDPGRNVVEAVAPGTAGAKHALTRWRELRVASGPSGPTGPTGRRGPRVLLELVPETGRPHQLRHAAASLGAPLCGDLKYGASRPLPDRSIALHARRLAFPHPTSGELLAFEAPPPASAIWDLAREHERA